MIIGSSIFISSIGSSYFISSGNCISLSREGSNADLSLIIVGYGLYATEEGI